MTRSARSALTERAGVTAAQNAFGTMGWFFREQPLIDFGIDAQVEIVEDNEPNGRLIALQIKSGPSFFARKRGCAYRFFGEKGHLEYWLRHCLPVFLVLHNPDNGMLLWQRVERHLVNETANGWSIDIPEENILDNRAAHFIACGISSDENSQIRFAFSTGLELMRQVEDRQDIYLSIDIWVNKSLGFRGAKIFYDDYNKEIPDLVVDTWAPIHSVEFIAQKIFPWAEFEYAEPINDTSGEVDRHVLGLKLNDYGKKFLDLERFYSGELEPPKFPDPMGDEDGAEYSLAEDDYKYD
jgi:hypothetical protein